MTKDDIIRMAREAGWDINDLIDVFDFGVRLERFAALVVAAEREACAAMFDDRNVWDEEVGERIRARGQA
jgi:hypothetical protein